MRTFNVSQTLLENVKTVLDRRGIRYTYQDGKINTNISGQRFHACVVRAKMEKLQEEQRSPIPYVAKTEVGDPEVDEELEMTGAIII